ncbi:hypothetical protein EGR52_11250 [bacterium]|nr:hypothetical protein [bacterium]
MKRGFIVIGCLLFLLILGFNITYGLFESKKDFNSIMNVAKFNLLVNNSNIVDTKSFNINNITVIDNENVLNGKIAPGVSGYFELVLDPKGSDVSIYYEVSLDLENILNKGIVLEKVVSDNNNLIRVDKYSYAGVFTLDEIKNNVTKSIKLYFSWVNNDETLDDIKYADGLKCDIKANVKASQYFGEDIPVYSEEI